MSGPRFEPLASFREYPVEDMVQRARAFREEMARRRTVRDYAPRPVPREVVLECLRTAGTAPSGANMQPWHFVVVEDAAVKCRIREAAEREEHEFYTRRATPEWLAALAALGTDEHKPFLEEAPLLIAVFIRKHAVLPGGTKVHHYYATESVGLATGILVTALHHAGLATLTHTPSPMGFLNGILGRPPAERPFLLLVVGYPAQGAQVPAIGKKPLAEYVTFVPPVDGETGEPPPAYGLP